MIFRDGIDKINDWFRRHEESDFGTYHHTEDKDGEDFYCVCPEDLREFSDFLRAEFPDLAYIPGKFSSYGIGFTSDDLFNSVCF